MYQYKKKIDFVNPYKWNTGDDIVLCVYFFSALGCAQLGAVRIKLYNEKTCEKIFYLEKIIRKDNYKNLKDAFNSFIFRYIGLLGEIDSINFLSAIDEAFGGCILSLTKEEIEW